MLSWKTLIAALVCAVLSASLAAQDAAKTLAAKPDVDAAFWKSVFTDNHVLQMELSVTREQFDAMPPTREGRHNKFSYVRAAVTIDGQPFEGAGLRFKGNSSFGFSRGTSKRPFKIDLNRFSKQKLHGRTKINLSTSFLDPAYMKEKLGYEIYRAAGMATPGVGWANVTLAVEGEEKELLGIYVLIEQVDERFLVSNLGKASKGSLLMKPDGIGDWQYFGDEAKDNKPYGIKLGEKNSEQIRRFAQLLQLIEKGTDEDFAKQIAQRMDVVQFAGYLAATSLLANVDSYIGMPHNYYLLLDKSDNKLRMLPWDLNETFGAFTMGRDPIDLTQWAINRPWVSQRRLVERLFATDWFPKMHRAAIESLIARDFTEAKMFERLQAFEAALTLVMKANKQDAELANLRMGLDGDIAGINAAVRRRVLAIKPFIHHRIVSVKAQLNGTSEGKELHGRRPR
ncbi:MAG: spore coat protein H [Planctomycetota bacterium]|jgi:spore coat protein H